MRVRFQNGPELTASIDSGTPLTIVDLTGTGRKVQGQLRLEDATAPPVTRFVFKNPEVFDLSAGIAGLEPGLALQSVLGYSLLRNFVVRLSYVGGGTLTFKDQIPDSKNDLASDCDARLLLQPLGSRPSCIGVWGAVPQGGGLVAMGGDSWDLPASRLVIPLCMLPDAFDPSKPDEMGPQQQSGVAATAVLATGQGLSIMSRSLLDRLRAQGAPLVEQPPVTLHLPYGDETVTLVDVAGGIAAVSDETMDLGPCGELARRRRLLVGSRAGIGSFDRDHDGASVALVRGSVTFAVIDDTRALIQGLRQELQPFVGDVDVVLGGSLLHSFRVDLDYPGQRVILQCASDQAPGSCEVLPFCSASDAPRCPDKTP